MARPSLEVADVLNQHSDGFVARYHGHLSLGQLRVMSAIRACRTAALGGHVARCIECDHTTVSYNSCRSPADASRVIAEGAVDAIAFGRLFIANPDLPERIRTGAGFNEFAYETAYGGGAHGYVDYPRLHEG